MLEDSIVGNIMDRMDGIDKRDVYRVHLNRGGGEGGEERPLALL